MTPPNPHWWHITLHASAAGLVTEPIPAGDRSFELLLDLTSHRLAIVTSRGERREVALQGQSESRFYGEVLGALAEVNIAPLLDRSLFTDETPGAYDPAAVARFWQAFTQVDLAMRRFKDELRGATSPVHLFPHGFDAVFAWFSGRLVPGVDPDDRESAEEMMGLGFSTGDDANPEPYFYVYPNPEGITDSPLPGKARWTTRGFTGAIMDYADAAAEADPSKAVVGFLRAAQQAGASRMR